MRPGRAGEELVSTLVTACVPRARGRRSLPSEAIRREIRPMATSVLDSSGGGKGDQIDAVGGNRWVRLRSGSCVGAPAECPKRIGNHGRWRCLVDRTQGEKSRCRNRGSGDPGARLCAAADRAGHYATCQSQSCPMQRAGGPANLQGWEQLARSSLKIGLLPQDAGTAMVVVARDHPEPEVSGLNATCRPRTRLRGGLGRRCL